MVLPCKPPQRASVGVWVYLFFIVSCHRNLKGRHLRVENVVGLLPELAFQICWIGVRVLKVPWLQRILKSIENLG